MQKSDLQTRVYVAARRRTEERVERMDIVVYRSFVYSYPPVSEKT